jgi:hypothetical protein
MLEQNTLMCNIILFENKLKMVKLLSNMVADVHTKTLPKERHNKLITMFGLKIS